LNMKKIILYISAVFITVLLGSSLGFAQSDSGSTPGGMADPEPAGGAAAPVKVPAIGNSAEKKVVLNIVVTNKKTRRYLGGVTIQIQTDDASLKEKTLDPPKPKGFETPQISSGRHTISADRYGYKKWAEVVNVNNEAGYQYLKIEMEAVPGVPDVTKLSRSNYWGASGLSRYPNNLYTNQTTRGNSFFENSVLNPYTTPYQNYNGNNYYGDNYGYGSYNPTLEQSGLPSRYQASGYLNEANIMTSQISNYQMINDNQGNYYILIGNNFNARRLYFVDSGNGQGGLVFFSGATAAFNSTASSTQSGNWYVSLYSVDQQTNRPVFSAEIFSKVAFSPDQYWQAINGQIATGFYNSPR